MSEQETVKKILDIARWAPSGDNTQPWRFELLGGNRFRVHAHDTRDWCVYDFEGHASQIAVGALLESIALAASAVGLEARFELDPAAPAERPVIDVDLVAETAVRPDPLHAFIEQRVTQRRPFSAKPLSAADKSQLEAAVGSGYQLLWIEGARSKRKMARLLFRNAHIRLTTREAFEVHRRIIEWDADESVDRIPDRAIGLDSVALKAMKWAMVSWSRVDFLNRYMGGTLLPRLQMDFLPALGCAAHFLLWDEQGAPDGISDYLRAGRVIQRLWLTATSLGLQFQPETTPLIFSQYSRRGVSFSENERSLRSAAEVKGLMDALFGPDAVARGVFMGRVGYGNAPDFRSTRLPSKHLITSK